MVSARFLSCMVVLLCLGACGGGGGDSSSGSSSGGGGSGNGGPTTPPPASGPENRPPIVAHENSRLRVIPGFAFEYDASQGGTTFSDPDGDPLTYRIESIYSIPSGITLFAARMSGTIQGFGTTLITVIAEDGRGGTARNDFWLDHMPNVPPAVVRPNEDRLVAPGTAIDVDVTRDGAVFSDADGHALSYRAELLSQPGAIQVLGTRLSGTLPTAGAVVVRVTAQDAFGGGAVDEFVIASPAQLTSSPILPQASYVYEDDQLPMPFTFRDSRQNFAPLWDTQQRSTNVITNAGATLGRVLFYDKRLSVTNTIACGNCHEQQRGFTVAEKFATGFHGALTRRNPMSLTNVRFNLDDRYFGDLRVSTLETLALLPIQDHTEMGSSLPQLEQELAATDFYPPLFDAAFDTPEVTSNRIARALAQFLRSLVSYSSKFDQAYHPMQQEVPHPETVLTAQELRGAEIFNGQEGRCALFCHNQGSQTMDSGALNNGLDALPTDQGAGHGNFRAPSLRNVAVSAPYMHDGRFATLREVIEHYSSGVVDSEFLPPQMRGMLLTNSPTLNLSESDKQALEAFLNTFTDRSFLEDPKFSDPFQ